MCVCQGEMNKPPPQVKEKHPSECRREYDKIETMMFLVFRNSAAKRLTIIFPSFD